MNFYNKFLLLLKSLILGILLVCFLIFNGIFEKMTIVIIVLIIVNIIKTFKLNIQYIIRLILGLIVGYVIFSIIIYFHVVKYNEYFLNIGNEFLNEKNCGVLIVSDGEASIFDSYLILKCCYKESNFLELIVAPFKVFKYKLAYEKLGKSDYINLIENLKEKLQNRLGEGYDIYISYLNVKPYFEKEICRLSEKYDKLIVVPLYLTENKELKEIKEVLKNYSDDSIFIKIIPSFWESEKLNRQIAKKILSNIGEDEKKLVGIVIVNSDKYSNKNQIIIFINKLIKNLKKEGFDSNKIVYTDLNKDIDLLLQAISNIREKGISEIIVVSISDITDKILVQSNVKQLIKKISKREGIRIIYLNGWGIGENLLNELEYKIRLLNLQD
ncbi:ferrochelatase [Caminicella sporogenes DSM 14501]|uniref:Ferrochelatase n=1 Tax=Caminicella sporogenes DSM 14501 TaxID=1121266 RepID=A0A1M6L029_9FIRM|nr:ferrochelatase [Caminicella sporogenes]RKD27660.1 hypothetical protein BET04_00920 [Caminicella sporogenes]SHJ64560.1 ferrochelatase [Caminicella sporogenes DSM 14501]